MCRVVVTCAVGSERNPVGSSVSVPLDTVVATTIGIDGVEPGDG